MTYGFVLQEYSGKVPNVSKLGGVMAALHIYSCFGKGLTTNECARALNGLKDNAEVSIYCRECLRKSRYKLFGGRTPSQMLLYGQTRFFHQDHLRCSEVKKDDSNKHKQMVQFLTSGLKIVVSFATANKQLFCDYISRSQVDLT